MQKLSSHEAFHKIKGNFSFNRLRRLKIVYWVFGHLTSLIHKIAIAGHPELEHISFSLEIGLPTLEVWWVWDRNADPRSDSSDFPSYNFENKCFLYDVEACRSKTSWKIDEFVLMNSTALFAVFSFLHDFDSVNWLQSVRKTRSNSLNSQRTLVHTEMWTKNYPNAPNESQVSDCKQESSLWQQLAMHMQAQLPMACSTLRFCASWLSVLLLVPSCTCTLGCRLDPWSRWRRSPLGQSRIEVQS